MIRDQLRKRHCGVSNSHCPRRRGPRRCDMGFPNGCPVIVHFTLGIPVRVRQSWFPDPDKKFQMSLRVTVRDHNATYFDLPPSRLRPALADEILPASVSSPLPRDVVVATLVERLVTLLSCSPHNLEACISPIPLLTLPCGCGNFRLGLLLGYYVIQEFKQIFEILQFSVIFLAEPFQLRRILVADSRFELG